MMMPKLTGTVLMAGLIVVGSGCQTTSAEKGKTACSSTKMDCTSSDKAHKAGSVYDLPGFETLVEDGRLWVFRAGSEEAAKVKGGGELAKHVIRIKAGPMGMTVKAPDTETVVEYLTYKPGFETLLEDGRLWVFRAGSEEAAKVKGGDELAKHVIRIKAGPMGMTVKAPDTETLNEYLFYKPGFETAVEDGRLWVFRAGSEEAAKVKGGGELAKHVIRIKAGPMGMTVKAPDTETLVDYMVAKPGFETHVEEGRLWVFRAGSEEAAKVKGGDELAKHVIRIKAGPMGMTVKAPDTETVDAYLR